MMGLPSRRRLKKELNRRLLYYPLLRMLLFKVWFRVAFTVALATAVLLGLYLPKIWRTSPGDFNPIVKVSALDFTQAWSLKRSARQAQEERDYPRAYLSWQAAVAQNPADETALRGFLKNFLHLKNPDQRQVNTAIGQSFWLLRLGKTNSVDLDLCASLYEHFRWYDVMLYAMRPVAADLQGTAAIAYAKALFHQGRMREFATRLSKLNLSSDPELPLYKLAFDAGWAVGPESVQAQSALAKAAEDPATSALATRLLMAAAENRGHVLVYQDCLQRLGNSNDAGIIDHVKFWGLLASNGRKSEAVRLAEQFDSAPTSAIEVLRLASIYFKLDLVDQCREVLKRFAPQFGHSPEVWTTYASVLEGLEEWTEMRSVALQIREQPNYHDTLGGYSFYLEGRAEFGQERKPSAELAFRKASQSTFETPALGVLVAEGLLKLQFPQYARPILEDIEEPLQDDEKYWNLVFQAAQQLKDAEWLLQAAEKTYAANPHDIAVANRCAAALMANRTRPAEAVQLTLRILSAYPRSHTASINHALALLLNKRTVEAKAELETVSPAALGPSETPAYHLAMFELAMNEQAYSDARSHLEKISLSHLFPPQRRWLEEQIKLLPPNVTSNFP